MRILAIVAVIVSCTLARAGEKPPDWSKIEIKAQKVAGQVYLVEGLGPEFSGGNVGASIGPDGILLVDDKFAPLAPKIQAALKTLSDKPVRFVLNTHVHQDHTGANVELGKGATIIAHDNTRARLARNDGWEDNDGKPLPVPAGALPVVTFADAVTVHHNGEAVRLEHVPAAHTDSDAVIFFPKSKVVHMGDLYFSEWYPFIDYERGGTVKGYLAGVEKVAGEIPSDAKIIPGHGPIATPTELRAWLAMLKDVSARVEAGIKSGKTLAQIQKDKPAAKYDAQYGHGFLDGDHFVEELYRGLTRH
jgi:glyoxylase-like metal-dependent hydrolase (beta-lactamase superfamily II)